MILQLLVFGRRVPHQCPSCQAEVGGVHYIRRSLQGNIPVPPMGGEYIFAPLYLAQGTPRYNEEVKLVYDKFLGLVNRMDFTSQEKIILSMGLEGERQAGMGIRRLRSC